MSTVLSKKRSFTERYPLIRLFFIHTPLLLMGAAPFVVFAAYQVHYFLVQRPPIQVRPEIAKAMTLLFCIFLLGTFFYYLQSLYRQMRISALGHWSKAQVLVSVLVQFLLRMVIVVVFICVSFSLSGEYIDGVTSPNGRVVAYLFTDGVLCGYRLFMGDRYGLFIHQEYQTGHLCKSDEEPVPVGIDWLPGAPMPQVRLTNR